MGAKHLMVLQHRIGLPIDEPCIISLCPCVYSYVNMFHILIFCAVLTGNVSYWFLMRLSCARKL